MTRQARLPGMMTKSRQPRDHRPAVPALVPARSRRVASNPPCPGDRSPDCAKTLGGQRPCLDPDTDARVMFRSFLTRRRRTVRLVDEADWARLISQLGSRDRSPGAGACAEIPPGGSDRSSKRAARNAHPFADQNDLARVMRYAALTPGDPVHAGNQSARVPAFAWTPEFNGTQARMPVWRSPIPVFAATNYDDFLVPAPRNREEQLRPCAVSSRRCPG